MPKTDRKIIGAVAVDGYTRSFVAGDEEALDKAITEDTEGKIDVERLSKSGVLVGFGKATAESAQTRNRQRDPDSGEAVEEVDETETAADAGPAKVPARPDKPEKTPRAGRAKAK